MIPLSVMWLGGFFFYRSLIAFVLNTFVCYYLAYFQAIGKNRIVYSISAVLNIVILPLFYLLGKAFGARGIWISFSLQFVIVVSYVIIVALIMGRKNKIVAGMNDEDMALAANTLIECGGGLCAVADGTLLALVHLPIAGLMNDVSAEQMDGLLRKLGDAWKEMGCTIHSPFMTMAYISLACIPELRLTNRGLVDCRTFRSVNAFIKEET